ncbi:MAG: hypothetical protein COA79_02050 [Planctomycetota bacterium]|nr:MAG: hypothetical protein COA79_02050 [Planctomycetota bacterium]
MAINFNKQSLGEQIALMLKEKIHSQKFEGGMLPKEEDLAIELNVSRGTVRSAMSILVDEELIIRVKKKGTFVNTDKVIPSNLTKFKRLNVFFIGQKGDIEKDMGSNFYGNLISSIFEEANKQKYFLNLAMLDHNDQKNVDYKSFLEDDSDGHILVGIERKDIITEFLKSGKPTLLLDHSLDLKGLECFDVDSYKASSDVVDFLWERGHRKFIFLRHHRFTANPGRISGVLDRLKELGCPKENIIEDAINPRIDKGYDAIMKLSAEIKKTTAIITFDSLMATGAIRAVREMGLNVPDDISIISCSNNILELDSVNLTSIEFDLKEYGVTAVKHIVDRINGSTDKPIQNAIGKIIERGSVRKLN